MWPNTQFAADSVTFTEEILNGKFHFLCSACTSADHDFSKVLYCKLITSVTRIVDEDMNVTKIKCLDCVSLKINQ